MDTQRIISGMICFLLITFLSPKKAKVWTQNENFSIQIASSNHPLATAYNNGRRIARNDNSVRYVVFQDFDKSIPIVCFVHSLDGKTWSQPDTLFTGAFPSIAIDRINRLYLAWQAVDSSNIFLSYSSDWGMSWKTPPINISQCDSEKTKFPVVEAGFKRLHIAWQQDCFLQTWQKKQEIYYSSNFLDSLESNFSVPANISGSEADSKFPSIAHNLGFKKGNLHVVWYDSVVTDSLNMTQISYRAFDETKFQWFPPLSHSPYNISEQTGIDAVHPAISVDPELEIVHVVWGNWLKISFYNLVFDFNSFNPLDPSPVPFKPFKIQNPADPFICIDDAFMESSALVWANDDKIFYMQSYYPQTIFSDFVFISNNDSIGKVFPNVCYKHFRYDSLDAIWTEGDTPPYKIMYRRIKKNYSSQDVGQKEMGNPIPQQLTLKQNYPNPFNSLTDINYELPNYCFTRLEIYNLLGQKVRTIVAENKVPGEYRNQWDGRDDRGNLLPTGIYLYQLQAGSQKSVRKIAFIK